MLNHRELFSLFPLLWKVRNPELAEKACNVWIKLFGESNWQNLEDIPFSPDKQKGSLVDHTKATMDCAFRIAEDMTDIYPISLDSDRILISAFLHDVSKIAEYSICDGDCVRTKAGRLYQHAFLGAHEALNEGIPPEIVSIIIGHTPQSNVKMRFLEGVIVKHAEAAVAEAGTDYEKLMRDELNH